MAGVGRNDPCPCGSGRKYKRCHLAADAAADAAADGIEREAHAVHDLDHLLAARMIAFATTVLGPGGLGFDFDEADDLSLQFLLPWALYHVGSGGTTIAKFFLEAEGDSLTARERSWLDAQIAAWPSVWEVESVQPGRRIRLRDLLTGERRDVREMSASKQLIVRHNVLARIADFEGESYICGMHPAPLAPLPANEVVAEVRWRLRVKRRVSASRLRGSNAARILMNVWGEVSEELMEQRAKGPTLANTEGDPLVMVTDRFAFEATSRDAIASVIRALPGVEEHDDGTLAFLRGDTIVATVYFTSRVLKVETNSLRRAGFARETMETACGELIRFKGRDVVDPLSSRARESAAASVPLPKASAEEIAVAQEWKARHYSNWPDEQLPALGGQTPREAMATAHGRERVDALLRDIEHHEARLDPEERFDVGVLRRELGLGE